MTKAISIVEYRNEITEQVMKNKEVFNALAQNTFKGLDAKNIPQALLEGRMRGFTIEDFMIKDVYALPFWNFKEKRQDYSLVVAISKMRKTAMRSGQSGKSAPSYTEVNVPSHTGKIITEGGKQIETCSVTVWRKGGDDRGYTATVYFDEYEKPSTKNKETGRETPGMWQTKKRTMIAKVAEVHALRMAFPEELGQYYVEEEFEREHVIATDVVPTVDPEEKAKVINEIKDFKDLATLQKYFKTLKSDFIKDDEVVEAYNTKKNALQNPPEVADKTVKPKK